MSVDTDIFSIGNVRQGFVGVKTSSGSGETESTLGLGPSPGSATCSNGLTRSVPTLTNNLFEAGIISSDVLGISFEPTTTTSSTNGELTFGGTDASKYTGTITYQPITTTAPSSEFWGVDVSAKYGTTSLFSSTAGIIDTGTTLLLIASNAFSQYQSLTGAKMDETTGLLKITSSQLAKLQSIFFVFGSTTFEFTANAQLWPRSLNTFIGGTSSGIYLIVNSVSL